jgi:hypothetical protein
MPASRFVHVEVKTRKAKKHLDELQWELNRWIDSQPYTITDEDDLQKLVHICRIKQTPAPEQMGGLLGDFISNLRSALDNLAWVLAHLSPKTFTKREETDIAFPVASSDDGRYRQRLGRFPSAVARDIDRLQPYRRGNTYRDDPLWQLNELWNTDKHRIVPINGHLMTPGFPMRNWQHFAAVNEFDYGLEVIFPLAIAWASPVELKPSVSTDILFGDHMSTFEVSRRRLSEIYEFVAGEVIPHFMGFFSETPNPYCFW